MGLEQEFFLMMRPVFFPIADEFLHVARRWQKWKVAVRIISLRNGLRT